MGTPSAWLGQLGHSCTSPEQDDESRPGRAEGRAQQQHGRAGCKAPEGLSICGRVGNVNPGLAGCGSQGHGPGGTWGGKTIP